MLDCKFHFISGLPRSGSTLLAALLRQNPRFHAAMSSPVSLLMEQMLEAMGEDSEHSVFISPQQKKAIIQGIFTGYYQPQAGKEIIFDTNRRWCSKLPIIRDLFPSAKVICCVRNIAWIADSIERLIRQNTFEVSRLFGSPAERRTVYSRTEALTQSDRLIGFSYNALKEGFYSENSEILLLVDYEIFTQNPAQVMEVIYKFLGEDLFEHDFENVQYEEPEFDRNLNTPELHTVRSKVEYKARTTILPPDLFDQFNNMSFWTEPSQSKANIIVGQSKETNLLKVLS
jgi:sulfotransferase